MKYKTISELSIVTGAVSSTDIGYILACDPEMEEKEVLHTQIFRWESGSFEVSLLNFSAHTCCIISEPNPAFVKLAAFGEYEISTDNKNFRGNVFKGQPMGARFGAFRMVSEIAGNAYATGLGGIVYRLAEFGKWVPIDKGLPISFEIEAIDGFDAGDFYTAGFDGGLWHFDGRKWTNCDLPTNENLNTVKCAGDGNIYVAGYGGCILCGRNNSWYFLAEDEAHETFWDLEWFEGDLYLSTISFVYRLKEGRLDLVDFGDDTPDTCYQLKATKEVMWSIGARDVMMFNGETWTRIV